MKLEVDLTPGIEEQLTEVATKVWEKTYLELLHKKNYPEWMNLEDTCDYLGVSRSTLNTWITKEGFPVSIVRNVKRCNKKQVDEWLTQFQR